MGPRSELGRLSRRRRQEGTSTALGSGKPALQESLLHLTIGDYWPQLRPISIPSLEIAQARLARSRLCNHSLSTIFTGASTSGLRGAGRSTLFTTSRTSRSASAPARYLRTPEVT